MQLNPQIQKLVNTIKCNHCCPSLKIEVNDRKIKLIGQEERVENIDFSPKGFLERFINLKSLTMVWYRENLEMICNKIAKLQVLRVIYQWTHPND